MQETFSSTSPSSMPRGQDTNSECATNSDCASSRCANAAFHLWLSALDDDAAAVFANASADQVLQLTGRATSGQPGEAAEPSSAVFVAVGACCAGSGGLTWEATQQGAVVRAKYRMMAAMLKDGARNVCFARAIERRVREQQRRTGEPPLVLDIGTGSGFLGSAADSNPNPKPEPEPARIRLSLRLALSLALALIRHDRGARGRAGDRLRDERTDGGARSAGG